jgi:Tol biopolymer transport system component
MPLSSGARLGPYEIVAPLGAGSMGEVYRARDPRLDRDVAIKVLPTASSANPNGPRRFEQEARAAASLSHPNILAIHDFGTDGGVQYVVSELLVGQTLRGVLAGGALPTSKTIEYAVQVATGLAAAHDQGIIHRDLKPENLFVTRDGRVKILDFGLAKLMDVTAGGAMSGEASLYATRVVATTPGVVLGTAGYMAPEQVRSQHTDQRTDIFALGVVIFEMLSGRRPFAEPSAIETMTAIATKDPPDLATLGTTVQPAVARIVRRCLEKRPEDRFQSARDLAFALEALADGSPGVTPSSRGVASRRTVSRAVLAGVVLAMAAGVGALAALRATRAPDLSVRRLTFQRGIVRSARFAPDGRTITYSAAWNGGPSRVFVTRSDTRESSPLDVPAGDLVATTSTGEIVLLVGRGAEPATGSVVGSGTLARASLTGGAARELVEGVADADASADGSAFAIVRGSAGRQRLEFPVGHVLYETAGYISAPRISPRGDRVAFLDHPVTGDDRGVVAIVDRAGSRKTLTREWIGEQGLAWSADGREIWFDAGPGEEPRSVYAVTPKGDVRLVYRAPIALKVEDVGRDGRVLLSGEYSRQDITGLPAGEPRERDLSWFNLQSARALSPDGRTLVFSSLRGFNYGSYVRKTDGSGAVRLGEGNAQDLSPDGKWVIATSFSSPDSLALLPTGPGESRTVALGPVRFDASTNARWMADGRRIVFGGLEPGHRTRSYVVATSGGSPIALTPEGVVGTIVSPDDRLLVVRAADGRFKLFDVKAEDTRDIAGLLPGETVVRWDASGRSLYVYQPNDVPLRIFRIDIATGFREQMLRIEPNDPNGIITGVLLTADGRSSVYNIYRRVSDLYVVTGLR